MFNHKGHSRGTLKMITHALIQESNALTEEIIQLKVTPEDQAFSWLAGQWIDFECIIEGQTRVAGYSICSAAGHGAFELLVRRSRHPVSIWLHEADRSGESIRIQGGSGDCVYLPEQHEELVCIAGGIGITPLISMLRTARQYQRPATMYHSVRQRDELLFADEFPDAHMFVTGEDQRLDFTSIVARHGVGVHYFLCGPRSFIDEGAETLARGGAQHVHFERWW